MDEKGRSIQCGVCSKEIEPVHSYGGYHVNIAKAGNVCGSCGTLMCYECSPKQYSHNCRGMLDANFKANTGKTLTEWRAAS